MAPPGFAFGSSPRALMINSCRPFGVIRTDDGIQPVGTNPSARPARGVLTSKTATLLLLALATNSVLPSGDSARLSGVEPGGSSGAKDDRRVSTPRPVSVSMTVTVLRPPLETKRWRPSGESSISFGCSPASQRALRRPSVAFSTATADVPHRLAYTRPWRASQATASGSSSSIKDCPLGPSLGAAVGSRASGWPGSGGGAPSDVLQRRPPVARSTHTSSLLKSRLTTAAWPSGDSATPAATPRPDAGPIRTSGRDSSRPA